MWIVIDAMRLDFITDENHQKETPFINKVLKSNQAKVYKAIAKAPTVTMPRIKVSCYENFNQNCIIFLTIF